MENDNLKKEILGGVKELLGQQAKDIKELLGEQTVVILTAVDEKIAALDLKFTQKFNDIITTLDGFSEKISTLATEFTMMQQDIKRMKKVIKEKLGVEL